MASDFCRADGLVFIASPASRASVFEDKPAEFVVCMRNAILFDLCVWENRLVRQLRRTFPSRSVRAALIFRPRDEGARCWYLYRDFISRHLVRSVRWNVLLVFRPLKRFAAPDKSGTRLVLRCKQPCFCCLLIENSIGEN